jgi:hypothetical protein
MNGNKAGPTTRVAAGQYHFEIAGRLKPVDAANGAALTNFSASPFE